MRPLGRLTRGESRSIVGVVFDLDDTLLTHGELTLRAYASLHQLRRSGLRLVICTGRPLGWAEVLVRQWPVDLAVAENGAIAVATPPSSDGSCAPSRAQPSPTIVDRLTAAGRAARRSRLLEAAGRLAARYPVVGLADDNTMRRTDVTFDVGERAHVAAGTVAELVALARHAGMRTFHSSIHVHVTYDLDDKASGTLYALRRCFGEDPVAARHRYAFIGDSGSDGPCFAAFRLSFGVRNVERHLAALSVAPRYVSAEEAGDGFSAIARRLCGLRRPTASGE